MITTIAAELLEEGVEDEALLPVGLLPPLLRRREVRPLRVLTLVLLVSPHTCHAKAYHSS
jgi:hypothetical protein